MNMAWRGPGLASGLVDLLTCNCSQAHYSLQPSIHIYSQAQYCLLASRVTVWS